jgi:hypothetical protein
MSKLGLINGRSLHLRVRNRTDFCRCVGGITEYNVRSENRIGHVDYYRALIITAVCMITVSLSLVAYIVAAMAGWVPL